MITKNKNTLYLKKARASRSVTDISASAFVGDEGAVVFGPITFWLWKRDAKVIAKKDTLF